MKIAYATMYSAENIYKFSMKISSDGYNCSEITILRSIKDILSIILANYNR